MNFDRIDIANKELNLNVRKIDMEKDKEAIIQFRKDTEIQSVGNIDGFDSEDYINRVKERVTKLPNGQLMIESEDVPVGRMGLGISEYDGVKIGYIDLLYLVPEYRGKGIGKELIRYAERFFKELNVFEYHLRVSSSNVGAIRLYTNSGMEKLKEENEDVPVWRMRKKLRG